MKKQLTQKILQKSILFSLVMAMASTESWPIRFFNQAALAAQATPTERRVMIMPFKNLTRAEVDNWLGDSLAESLLMGLGQLRSLKLVERAELAQIIKEQAFMQSLLADQDKAPEIGKMVGADQMILGSYQKIGNRIQINVRLVNVSTGEIDQSSLTQVQGSIDSLFELETDLAKQLLAKLNVNSSSAELSQMQQQIAVTTSTKAHEYYQKAKRHQDDVYLSDQKMQESIRYFKLAVQEDPLYAQAYVGLSELLAIRGRASKGFYTQSPDDLSQALLMAEKALQIKPNLDSAYRAKAKALSALKRDQEALQFALKSVELSNSTENIIWYLSLKYPNFQTQDLYETFFQELTVLQADMNDPQILSLLASQYISKFMMNPQTDLTPAIQMLERSLAVQPKSTITFILLASMHMLKRDIPKAEVYVQKMMELDSDNVMLLFSAANLLRFANKDKAFAYLKKTLEIDPNFYYAYLLLMEMDYHYNKDFEKVLEHYQSAVQIEPQISDADSKLGYLYYRAKRYQDALLCFEKALSKVYQFDPENSRELSENLIYLGNTYFRLKQYQQARQQFEKVLTLPRLDDLTLANTHNDFALLELDQKSYSQALEHFKLYLGLAPGYSQYGDNPTIYRLLYLLVQEQQGSVSAAAFNDIGQGFYLLEKYEQALLYFQKGIQLDSQNPTLHFNLGLLHLAQKNIPAAQSEFEQAIAIKPDYVKALFSLGQLAQEQGNNQLAKNYFARILKSEPQNERAREAFEKL